MLGQTTGQIRGENCAPKKEGQVKAELIRLRDKITLLKGNVNELYQELKPVMTEIPSDVASEPLRPANSSDTLYNKIAEMGIEIAKISDFISVIRRQLEL